MRLDAHIAELELAHPFAISRSVRSVQHVVEVRLEHEGIVAYGEAAPVEFWFESAESALSFITAEGAGALGSDLFAAAAIERRLGRLEGEQGAKRALDAARCDWLGKRLGQPLWRLLGLEPAGPPTSVTIAIDSISETEARTKAAQRFGVIKLKVGSADDLDRLDAVRDNTGARIRVDANEGWTLETARRLMPALVARDVELVEQPFPAGDEQSYRRLARIEPRPVVIVDEGCRDLTSVARVAPYADGINIKLAKSAGLPEALRMIHAARALDLRVMLGCMIESELGIAHACQIASLADYVDLDGHLLIKESPFRGLGFVRGSVACSQLPGLGVEEAG